MVTFNVPMVFLIGLSRLIACRRERSFLGAAAAPVLRVVRCLSIFCARPPNCVIILWVIVRNNIQRKFLGLRPAAGCRCHWAAAGELRRGLAGKAPATVAYGSRIVQVGNWNTKSVMNLDRVVFTHLWLTETVARCLVGSSDAWWLGGRIWSNGCGARSELFLTLWRRLSRAGGPCV